MLGVTVGFEEQEPVLVLGELDLDVLSVTCRGRPGAARAAGPRPLGPRRDPPGSSRAGPRGADGPRLSAYGPQAAIAECHAVAPSVGATNWERVVALYEALGQLAQSPVVDLNRAVAVAMAQGPAAALPIVDQLLPDGAARVAPAAERARGTAHPAVPQRRGA